ncbi:hypothetical protein ACLOJK_034260 [Asimina triloba]
METATPSSSPTDEPIRSSSCFFQNPTFQIQSISTNSSDAHEQWQSSSPKPAVMSGEADLILAVSNQPKISSFFIAVIDDHSCRKPQIGSLWSDRRPHPNNIQQLPTTADLIPAASWQHVISIVTVRCRCRAGKQMQSRDCIKMKASET